MNSLRVRACPFPSFHRNLEFDSFNELQISWTPIFIGVTTFYKTSRLSFLIIEGIWLKINKIKIKGLPLIKRKSAHWGEGNTIQIKSQRSENIENFISWSRENFYNPEVLARVTWAVIPAKAGIQNCLKILDSGSRFACPEWPFLLAFSGFAGASPGLLQK